MTTTDQPVMLSYRCPDRRAEAVRNLLAACQPAGVCFEEEPAPWWARIFGSRATFTIRCPDFFVERLHQELANR
jgi:hypothetical protein